MIEKTIIGRSDLNISRLGFGCWQLGGHGWQNNDQKLITDSIHHALELGINFFDTADIYGLGESESLLAQTLSTSTLGKQAIIATKFGVRTGENGTFYDNSQKWLFEAVEASLYRLKRETIDLYQIHWHDEKRPLEDTLNDLEKLRKQGKIRWYGISNIPASTIDTRNLPAGLASFTMKYNLIQRQNEKEILQTQLDKNLTFISWGSLAQGLLSGKYSRHSVFSNDDIRNRSDSLFAENNWNYYEPILKKLKEIADNNNKTMSQTALRFVLDFMPKSIVLAGIKNTTQLEENASALNWKLQPTEIAELAKIAEQKI